MDLLFLGRGDTTITIAALAAMFSADKEYRPAESGRHRETRNTDQALRLRNLSATRMKGQVLVQRVLAYLSSSSSSSLSLFLVATNPCVCNFPKESLET